MTWNNVLIKTVLLVITALGPLLTALTALAVGKVNSKIKNDKLRTYTSLLTGIVKAVVGDAQQTMVESIKANAEDGKLTLEEAKRIKDATIEKVITILPSHVYAFLEAAKLDVTALIDALIESTVHEQKANHG